jgi:hypothetical protein
MGTRSSARLAAKDSGVFVDATAKASQLKALQNSLSLCSKPVQPCVIKKKLLKRIGSVDLSLLAGAVGLGAATAQALDRVLATEAALGKELDLVLTGRK